MLELEKDLYKDTTKQGRITLKHKKGNDVYLYEVLYEKQYQLKGIDDDERCSLTQSLDVSIARTFIKTGTGFEIDDIPLEGRQALMHEIYDLVDKEVVTL